MDRETAGLIAVLVAFVLLLGGSCYWLGNKHGQTIFIEACEDRVTQKSAESFADGARQGYKEGLREAFREQDDDKRR